MSHRMPSLAALRAFEAAARHESFAGAGKELGLTPSAISQQVKALETELGVVLFQRLPRSLRLSDIGAAYASQLTGAFRLITEATEHASAALPGRKLRLGVGKNIRATLSGNWPKDQPDLEEHVVLASDSSAPAQISAGQVDAVLAVAPSADAGHSVEIFESGTAQGKSRPLFFICAAGMAACHQSLALRAWLRGA